MNSLLIEKICRICLKPKAKHNWNDEVLDGSGVTFRDCYYKYTQLEKIVPDYFPTCLCHKCACGIKQAHILFEKALDSYINLQNTLKEKDLKEVDLERNESLDEFDRRSTEGENCLIVKEETVIDEYEVILFSQNDDNAIKTEDSNNDLCNTDLLQESDFNNEVKNFKNLLPLSDEIEELQSTFETTKTARNSSRSTKEVSIKRLRNRVAKSKSRGTIEIIEASADVCELPNDPLHSANIEGKTTLPKCQKSRKNQKPSNTNKQTRRTRTIEENSTSQLALTEEFSETKQSSQKINTFEDDIQKNSATQEEISKNATKKPVKRIKLKRLLCQHCPYRANDRCTLAKHEAQHVKNRERNVICSICGVKFYSEPTLKWHMQVHEENRIKKHKCEFCEKAFFNKGALNVHRRIHLGLMVKCQICEKEFYRRIDLERHLMRQHSSSTSKQIEEKKKYVVQCKYCDKLIFTNNFTGHMARHLNQPQAKCKICEKDFFTKANCANHLRRFHKIIKSEIDKNVLYFGSRASFLKLRQEAEVKIVT